MDWPGIHNVRNLQMNSFTPFTFHLCLKACNRPKVCGAYVPRVSEIHRLAYHGSVYPGSSGRGLLLCNTGTEQLHPKFSSHLYLYVRRHRFSPKTLWCNLFSFSALQQKSSGFSSAVSISLCSICAALGKLCSVKSGYALTIHAACPQVANMRISLWAWILTW